MLKGFAATLPCDVALCGTVAFTSSFSGTGTTGEPVKTNTAAAATTAAAAPATRMNMGFCMIGKLKMEAAESNTMPAPSSQRKFPLCCETICLALFNTKCASRDAFHDIAKHETVPVKHDIPQTRPIV